MDLNVKVWYRLSFITEHGNHSSLYNNRRKAEKYLSRYKKNFQGDYIADDKITQVKQILTTVDFDDDGIIIPTYAYEELK